MKYYILPAKDVQAGDVIFTNNGVGIQFCGRVIGETVPRTHPMVTEWRVEVLVGNEDSPQGSHTKIGFRDTTLVGVAREDQYVETDIASLLADLI